MNARRGTTALDRSTHNSSKNQELTEFFRIFLFQVVLLGNGGVGKTAFFKRFSGAGFDPKYGPTMGKQKAITLLWETNRGPIKFKMWDTCGQDKEGELKNIYYEDAHGAIIMFDFTSRITLKNVEKLYGDLQRYFMDKMQIPMIPAVLACREQS
jgi:small GTP-binding protein